MCNYSTALVKMQKVRPYTTDIKLKVYNEMEAHYDILVDGALNYYVPRFWYDNRVMFKDIVYYISLLYLNNPKTIADIGSGGYNWKKWFDNIKTFEKYLPSQYASINTLPDSREEFNSHFVATYNKSFDCAMAINSLHFISWKELSQRITDAMSVVKDKFLFTININHINQRSDETLSVDSGINRLYDILNNSPFEIYMFDYNLDADPGINGHVRFILSNENN